VPASIARNEVLPRAARDPAWFAREGFRIQPGGAVVQPPGPRNALGRIKFLFPNRFGVYLHDTPSRSLFERETRAFSHGCMRVEKPLDLAVWVLAPDPAWTREAIEAAIERGRERAVPVPEPVAVHVVYMTAWVDDAGVLQLRGDVYGRDRGVAEVLQSAAATRSPLSARAAMTSASVTSPKSSKKRPTA
jgi:murein L,D-transpeptidase YcbB/YkuD